jgi:P-type Ca2+ transporter type 2C
VHIPIAGVALAAVAADWPLILLPIHVLFLEMVIDPACTVVFEADPEAAGLMARPPRRPDEPILDRPALRLAVLRGAAALAPVLVVAAWGSSRGWSEGAVRAAAFSSILLANLALILVALSDGRGLAATLRARNPALWWVVGGAATVLAASLALPSLRAAFHFDALDAPALAAVAAAAAASLGGMSLFVRKG